MNLAKDSAFAGNKLADIPFRTDTGVNIVKIQRGNRNINIPSGDEVLLPGDLVLAAGTTAQLESYKKMMAESMVSYDGGEDDFCVMPVILDHSSHLVGKSLGGLRLRDYKVMVISVLHEGDFITNPAPEFHFQEGDTVWLAGDRKSCEWLTS